MKYASGLRIAASGISASMLALLLATPAHALDVLAYGNDFDAAPTVFSGIGASGIANGGTTTAIGSYAASNGKSWSGNVFVNDSNAPLASTLTLTNLPTHTGVKVDFILGLLDSWDSDGAGGYGPDNLDLYINGVLVHQYTTNTALGGKTDYGSTTSPDTPASLLVYRQQTENHSTYYSDVLLDMGTDSLLTFAHSGNTLTFSLQASGAGWQGGSDESWGLDALSVTLTGVTLAPVPEPETYALLLAGLGLVAGVTRKRRK